MKTEGNWFIQSQYSTNAVGITSIIEERHWKNNSAIKQSIKSTFNLVCSCSFSYNMNNMRKSFEDESICQVDCRPFINIAFTFSKFLAKLSVNDNKSFNRRITKSFIWIIENLLKNLITYKIIQKLHACRLGNSAAASWHFLWDVNFYVVKSPSVSQLFQGNTALEDSQLQKIEWP